MPHRRRISNRKLLIIAVTAVLCAAAAAGVFFFRSRQRADRGAYYAQLSGGRGLLYLNGVPQGAGLQTADGADYLALTDAQALFSDRYYRDADTQTVRLALPDTLLVFTPGAPGYERDGAFYETDVPPLLAEADGYLFSVDMLSRIEGFTCAKTEDPASLILWTDGTEAVKAVLDAAAVLRSGPSLFSPVLADLPAGTTVLTAAGAEGASQDRFTPVLTETGEYGWIRRGSLDSPETVRIESPSAFAAPVTHRLTPARPTVLFHYVDDPARGEARLEEGLSSVRNINVLVPTCLTIADTGGHLADASSQRYVSLAHEAGIDVWLMAENINRSVSAAELFASSAARDTLRRQLIDAALRTGADGIDLDIEALKSETSYHFVQFVREIAADCRRSGLVLSVCVPPPFRYNRHLNYPELALYADYLIVMIYDESWKDPGPNASRSYVSSTLEACAGLFPAEQTIAGLSVESRRWRVTDAGTEKAILSMKDGTELLAQTPDAVWLEETGCYYADVPDEGGPWQVWFEEERSMRERIALIGTYHPAGYSVWRWGLESAAFWDLLAE